ncbi:hypothetical protein CASFOL_026096 [Castilleja foliolosa]|uniref:Uncharacterized protein n=1 Tax=Castilleja foliolosa TaxID=1961234 RepID=A0ABD3CUE5_9LAMI
MLLTTYEDCVLCYLSYTQLKYLSTFVPAYAKAMAVGMGNDVKSYDENLVGRRVKFWWPKDESFREGVVSSHDQSGKNLVVCANGVEEFLDLKRNNREPVKDGVEEKKGHFYSPSHTSRIPEGEELIDCRVKVWRPKTKTYSEGVVTSYDISRKEHVVTYANGNRETMNLRKHREPAGDVSPDQARNEHAQKACNPSSVDADDDMDAHHSHVGKKHKGQSFDHTTPSASSTTAENLKKPKLENDFEPMGSKLSGVPGDEHARKARDPIPMYADDDMDAHHSHVGKKHKGESFDHTTTPSASSTSAENLKKPKLENDFEPMRSKSSGIPGDDDLVKINGYKVRTTSAPVLEAIFAKYGDIMANCVCKSTSVRASLLEVICNIVRRLQNLDVEAILSELEDIENEISDLEAAKIKVSWLHEHLEKLGEIADFKDKSLDLKKTKVRSSFVVKVAAKELKRRHEELVFAQERFEEAEKCVNAMRLVIRKLEDDIMEYESEEYFWKRRLDDLI